MQTHGFRVFFTPLLEVLFTFPSRYWSTIGLSVVFSLAGWSPPIPAEFLVFRGTQVPAGALVRISGTGLSPAAATLSCVFPYPSERALAPVLQPRARPQDRPGLGCCAFARHYLRNHFCFLFLRVLRCFSSHSDIRGSTGICPSPRLFAACHVLRRLREPQASPMRPSLLSLFLSLARPASRVRSSLSILHRFFLLLAFAVLRCVLRVPNMSMNSSSP